MTSVRTFCKFARWENPLEEYKTPETYEPQPHPIQDLLIKRADGKILAISGLDRGRWMLAVSESKPDLQTAIAMQLLVGLRVSEVRALTFDSYDYRMKVLTVFGKGAKIRKVPVSIEAQQYLNRSWLAAHGTKNPLVPYGDRQLRKMITEAGETAKIETPVSSHDLRATFGTAVYGATKDRRLVQELLGHSKTVTDVYIGITMESMREAVEKIAVRTVS